MTEQTAEQNAAPANVMRVGWVKPEQMLAVTRDGVTERFVPEGDYETLLEAYFELRRTVSIAHAALVFDGRLGGPMVARDNAIRVIESRTGLTWEQAQATQGILDQVRDGSLARDLSTLTDA